MTDKTLGRYTTPPPQTWFAVSIGHFFIITIQTVFYLQAAYYSCQQNNVIPKWVQKKKDLKGKNKC